LYLIIEKIFSFQVSTSTYQNLSHVFHPINVHINIISSNIFF
jgi:hypothetical protein